MAEQVFFTRIDDPDRLRLELLSCSKTILQSSVTYYRLVGVRKQKNDAIAEFKEEVVALQDLFNSMKDVLPYQELLQERHKPKAKKSVKKKKSSPGARHRSEEDKKVEQLTEALSLIEQKLSDLTL